MKANMTTTNQLPEVTPFDIAEKIKGLRKSLGMTQAEFAVRHGLSRTTVAMYETGRVKNIKGTIAFDLLAQAHEAGKRQGAEEERDRITSVDYSLPQTTYKTVWEKQAFQQGWTTAIKMMQSLALTTQGDV